MCFLRPRLPETLTCCALPCIALRRGPREVTTQSVFVRTEPSGLLEQGGRDRVTHHTPPDFVRRGHCGGGRHLLRSRVLTTRRPQHHKNSPIVLLYAAYPSTRAANWDFKCRRNGGRARTPLFPRAPRRHVAITPVTLSNLPSFNPTGITTGRPLAQRDHRHRTVFGLRSETVQEEEKRRDTTETTREIHRDNPAGFTSFFPTEDGKHPITFHFIRLSMMC